MIIPEISSSTLITGSIIIMQCESCDATSVRQQVARDNHNSDIMQAAMTTMDDEQQ
jgi:hypothetical protein